MRVTNYLDPNQVRRYVAPDLSQDYLEMFSTDDTGRQRNNYMGRNDFLY